MDNNNWRGPSPQSIEPLIGAGTAAGTAPENGNWRSTFQPDSRQKIVNKIMETLKKHLPFSGQDGLIQLQNIAAKFEEKTYASATDQTDYLRKISLKMLTIETKSSSPQGNGPQPNPGNINQNPGDSAQIPMPIMGGQSEAHQQFLTQNNQSNMPSIGMQNSVSLNPAAPSVGMMTPAFLPNVNGQNSLESSMGQGIPSNNMFSSTQRQMPGRQQQIVSDQSQQPSQNSQHHLYQQQLQHQQNQQFPQGSMSQMHQQQQQQQQSQHTIMQNIMTASPLLPNLQQNQQSSQHPQPVRQLQQQLPQPIMGSQQQQQRQPQQHIIGQQQPSGTNIQHNQMMSQPNIIHDMKKQPPQPQMIGQQQQQLLTQQRNLSNMHQQQISKQNNFNGLQQSQMMGLQPNKTSMPSNQQNVNMIQQSRVTAQQLLRQPAGLVPAQGQQSQQMQLPQQQLMPQSQSQPVQLQKQTGGLQQQSNSLPRDMNQRLQASSPLHHHQNVVDPQKQLFQPQRQIPDGPSTSLDSTAQTGSSVHGGDWQEEAYQKIRSMKEKYFIGLVELYKRIASRLELHDIPQQPKNEQLEKLKFFKGMLEKLLQFLRINKNDIQIGHMEKIGPWEKQIVSILNSNRPKPNSSLPQGQLPQSRMQQNQQSQSQMSSQMQSSMNAQGSVLLMPMQQNNLSSLQHNSLASATNISNSQQNRVNSLQSVSGLDAKLGNARGSMPQVALGSIKQNPVSGSQQLNMIQHQQLKQEQHILQSQHLNQLPGRHNQFLNRQQMLQQQQRQQANQQQTPGQLPLHNMSQSHQTNGVSELKIRQQMGVKPGMLQQHHPAGQRAHHHPLKNGTSLISSPSQVAQHPSPQIDQQNTQTGVPKAGTPLQSSSSSFIVPSPSTPSAPSPMLAETEKTNTRGHQQATGPSVPAQSVAVGTPGISASPLLAEFTTSDGTHGIGDGKSTAVEQPHERLMRAVKSISSKALTAAVSNISSVVSMVDRVAGSAPGNSSRAAVGEDLVSNTKCRLHARDFFVPEGAPGSKKMRRDLSAMPSNVVSSTGSVHDSFRQIHCSEASDLESTATSCVKHPLGEPNHALIEEMRGINRRLIDTTIEISNEAIDPLAVASAAEGGEGTIVKCSYNAVALSPNFKALYASANMAPIHPLWLLVPKDYPHCSPILLNKFPVAVSPDYEDLTSKANSEFSISIRSLAQPMSLADIARTWDVCARDAIMEYAQQRGGGTFSSKYGTWENCLSAA